MSANDDLNGLNDSELLTAYVENVHAFEATEHVGAKNRLMSRRMKIVDILSERSSGTLDPMRILHDHPDPRVRHSAAIKFRTIDHNAFERVVAALAERKDELGRDARSSLELDAHFQNVGYPELEDRIWRTHGLPPNIVWQSNSPPPKSISTDAINALLDAFPSQITGRLKRLLRPAIGLWPQRLTTGMPILSSRLGGMPYAPPRWSWPIVNSEPMLFLGQINCSELNGLPGAQQLPPSGLIAFFGDHDGVMACDFFARDVGVFHWPDLSNLQPAMPPIELTHVSPLCALAFRPLVDLPDPYSRVVQDILTDPEQVSRYGDIVNTVRNHGIPSDLTFYCAFSKLFGWPTLIQPTDIEEFGDGVGKNGLNLLFQLDEYCNGESTSDFGPGGSIYFLIKNEDLRAGRFDQCQFDRQFT